MKTINKEINLVLANDYAGDNETIKTYRAELIKRQNELQNAGYSAADATKKAQDEWISWFERNY